MKRPAIGSQIIRDSDPLRRVGVVINVTSTENAFRYEDGVETFEKDVPFTYVGWSHPMKWHPVANAYRLFNAEELNSTVKSIKSEGQQFPIITFEDKIIDGRNRLLACNLAGVDPWIETQEFGDLKAIVSYVKAVNSDRRQMSKEDVKQAAADLTEVLIEDSKKNQGGDRRSKEAKSSGSNDHDDKKAREVAGEQFGISGATVQRVLTARRQEAQLVEVRPDLALKVQDGDLTLSQARIEAGLIEAPPQKQEDTVTVTFLHKHLKAFRQFAKENQIVWDSN
jgi:ParB-like chromosome segregation protein Spo0J